MSTNLLSTLLAAGAASPAGQAAAANTVQRLDQAQGRIAARSDALSERAAAFHTASQQANAALVALGAARLTAFAAVKNSVAFFETARARDAGLLEKLGLTPAFCAAWIARASAPAAAVAPLLKKHGSRVKALLGAAGTGVASSDALADWINEGEALESLGGAKTSVSKIPVLAATALNYLFAGPAALALQWGSSAAEHAEVAAEKVCVELENATAQFDAALIQIGFVQERAETVAAQLAAATESLAKSQRKRGVSREKLLTGVRTALENVLALGEIPVLRRATPVLGGPGGAAVVEDIPSGAVFAGFSVSCAALIDRIQPIYRCPDGQLEHGSSFGGPGGNRVEVLAREGYAVSGLRVKAGFFVDGFSVLFSALDGHALNLDDSYSSDWIGGNGGDVEQVLGCDGARVLGIQGRSGGFLDALGLLLS